METPLRLKPGTIAKWIVGAPGPDIDVCLVLACLEDGSHRIRFKVWEQGEWHETTTKPRKADGLYPSSPFVFEYPNVKPSATFLAELEAERDRLWLPAVAT